MKLPAIRPPILAALAAAGFALSASLADAAPFVVGDVFAAVGNGDVKHYSSTGVLKGTYNIGTSGFTTGMAFDGAGNLYVTGFSASTLAKFDTSGNLLSANFAAGLSTPESIVFDNSGNFFVGNLNNGIREYNSAGTFLGTVVNTRVDWLDLSADHSKFIYTQEGTAINTVSNALPGVAGPAFATGLTPGEAFALRYLADGGVLLADGDNIKRLNAAGVVIQTYDVTGNNDWFSLNLDPDGTTFWSGDFSTSTFYRFNIATGAIVGGPINTGTGSGTFFGLAVFGEITQGGPPPTGVPDAGSTLVMLAAGLAALATAKFTRRSA